ncbi:MAG: DUF445 domain-containing protein [Gammaproteobacteria bacterium]|nr:MAG: DUF445 domain-containing protein [Gammaproteobacteria bacterium]
MLSTNLITNLLALAVVLVGFALPDPAGGVILSIGLFALSGGLTNWLAIHMLFERIPGIYGSGIISLHFEEFKAGILRMVHEELFNREKVETLLAPADDDQRAQTDNDRGAPADDNQIAQANASPDTELPIDLEPIIAAIDLDKAFDQLVATVMGSNLGAMLGMFGGGEVLEQLRAPFRKRMAVFLEDMAASPEFRQSLSREIGKLASSDRFLEKLDRLLRARLDEMTPDMVRDLIQRMIRKHLGWLVIWGAVFGGIIGLAAALLRLYFQSV